jgi:hypothetical protein
LLTPVLAWSQGILQVGSVVGKVEIRPANAQAYQALTVSTRQVSVGDQIRTGPGSSVVLTLPDSSYMVVTENSDLIVRDFWSGGARSVVNMMLGRIRFYVSRIGGRPNPYRVETPTALIAVRGTIFDVFVDPSQSTEVQCLDGQVAVEAIGLPDREVILNPGTRTLVQPGSYPVRPVALNEELPNRTLRIVKTNPGEDRSRPDPRALQDLIRDNDRANRPSDRQAYPGSTSDPNVERAKGTVRFP